MRTSAAERLATTASIRVPARSRATTALVHLLFLASGATALVYQVTWARDLGLVFGSSYEAASIVLAAFMGGLSLGAFVAGRGAERMVRPLRAYAWAELGIAAAALALPLLLHTIDAAYVAFAQRVGGAAASLDALRAALAFAAVLLPTALMGATLPLLVRVFAHTGRDFGTSLAWLYGINTLGAVVGALGAGFALVPSLGVWHTQLAAVAVNASIGAVALAVDRRWRDAGRRLEAAPARDERIGPGREPAASPPTDVAHRLGLALAYRGAVVSGLCALALEVLWTRSLSIAVGTTTYSFTVMLAAFLTGIWLGSWLHAVLPIRRVRIHVQLGVVLLLIGAFSALASLWIPRLPELVVQTNMAVYGATPRIRPATALIAGFAIMLLPCLFMGVALPLAAEARAQRIGGFGRPAGDTLGWNTLGSIAGALLGGYALVPLLGLQRGMLLAAGVYFAYGCAMLGAPLVVAAVRAPGRALAAAAAVVGVGVGLSAPVWMPAWDVRRLGAFQNNHLLAYLAPDGAANVPSRLSESVVLSFQEGRAATVSVLEEAGYRALLVNGKAVASDNPDDIQHELLLGHVPALVHPDPKSALVVGMGTGITLGAVAAHPSLDEIELVEIEQAVVDAQPWFADVNGAPLADPRVHVAIGDGRNHLRTTPKRFDIITADPIHPWNRGSTYLYTREYYAIAKQRLAEGGVMCQWIPVYGLSIANFQSILATFAGAFAHTLLWQSAFDTVVIGSDAPLRIDLDRLAQRLEVPSVSRQLAVVGLADATAFVAEISMDDRAVRDYARGGVINTDDNVHLEFASPSDIGSIEALPNARAIDAYRAELAASDAETFGVLSAEEREKLDLWRRAKTATLLADLESESVAESVARLRSVVEAAPGYARGRVQLSRQLEQRAGWELTLGSFQLAVGSAEEAVAAWPENPYAHRTLGVALTYLGFTEEAVAHLQRSLALRPNRWRVGVELAEALARDGRSEEAAEALREAQAIHPAALARELEELAGSGRRPLVRSPSSFP